MGQKVNPISFRIGVTKDWSSRWYSTKTEFPERIYQDYQIRKIVVKELASAYLSHVDIERASNRVRILIYSGRPGMVIGRKGAQIEKVKDDIQKIIGDKNKLIVDIKEVAKPALDAKITADNIAMQLVKRMAFRRVMKKIIQTHREAGGEGIKIKCSGRLGGAEIARCEGYKWGKIPLQTIKADIDYGFSEARTTFGIIGIKVWVYRGEKFERDSIIALREKKTEQDEKSEKTQTVKETEG